MEDNNTVSKFKELIYRLRGKRKKIFLMGYSHSGKTTILKVLNDKRNVTPQEIEQNTNGTVPYKIEYGSFLITSNDRAGREEVYYQPEFDKIIKDSNYFLYVINADFYIRASKNQLTDKECCQYDDYRQILETIPSWLKELSDRAEKNNKRLVVVFSHADEYLEKINKRNNQEGRQYMKDMMVGEKGLMKGFSQLDTIVADVTKIREVEQIINKLISKQ